MPKFKVGDMVRVHPRYQTAGLRSDKVGRITSIKPDTHFPNTVQFNTHTAFFLDHELEKI